MRKWLVVSIGIFSILLFVLTTMIYIALNARNALVVLNEKADKAWLQVENQLTHRNDMISAMLATTAERMAGEKEALEKLADARMRLSGTVSVTDRIAAAGDLSLALSRLLEELENDPGSKNDETLMRLMNELADAEEVLRQHRTSYNTAIEDYNRKVTYFPSNLVAKHYGFDQRPYYREAGAGQGDR